MLLQRKHTLKAYEGTHNVIEKNVWKEVNGQ